ncbi:hypothetical protein DYB36_011061 [Aphanomyces astaci]|uniref:Elicitin n=1 Tax=Aphanomyces astaci TaxID=112090 RepID=A0A397AMS1_APHAT|nr:hypothetical protein DYB36_011061 [Aphanomyces astaci]
MKCLSIFAAITTTYVAAQDVECDVGAISKAFGPIVGELNECMTKSGYAFLPTPTKLPTKEQLKLFCSHPECDKAATSYAGISATLPVCQFVLDNQAVPTTALFSTLCPNYAGRTAKPSTAAPPPPATTKNQTSAAQSSSATTPAPLAQSSAASSQVSIVAALVMAVASAVVVM